MVKQTLVDTDVCGSLRYVTKIAPDKSLQRYPFAAPEGLDGTHAAGTFYILLKCMYSRVPNKRVARLSIFNEFFPPTCSY